MDKILTWFMRIRGAFADICRERRRLRHQWDHNEAYTTALQQMNEAANQMRILALNQRYSVLTIPTVPAGDPVGKTADRIGRTKQRRSVKERRPQRSHERTQAKIVR